MDGRTITIFKYKGYWFFDPEGRDDIGDITRPEKPLLAHCNAFSWPPNLACVMRFVGLKGLVSKIADNTSMTESHNIDYVLHPVVIKRKILENFNPPTTMEEFSAR